MKQSSIQSRPWNTPIWFMVVIMVLTFLENFIIVKETASVTSTTLLSGIGLFILMLWPSLILVDAIIYWIIRKRIRERKWVWAHLLFSLLGFVLLQILRFLIFVLVDAYNPDLGHTSIPYLNNMEFYGFWFCLVIGHSFFIIAIARSFSGKSSQLPPHDDNDLLSEVAS